ncbi:restriction endonuclease [Nonomuraea roseoviolacea]|uniref:Restriction system protein n=1 Tax=Nonomuraea roseoviolacea subsp. carminata TaxID=160689 RepID=A0ABT1KHX9_9ACTN|nr:restriction endonuclease [Nonomuraea roseoviolacea]MCP2352579.1 restriction system protein [Nonomuraea roseoviolacea subsp. carminata]
MARGSGRGKGRRASRGNGDRWFLALVGVLAVGALVAEFARAHPGWAAAIACLLVVLVVGGLVLRHRAIQAARLRFLAGNAQLEKVDRMTGTQFEHLVAERMSADGFRQVRERGGGGDRGVDITAVAPGHGRYAVQCKRYSKSVGAPEVRNFLGALANTFAGHTGVLVTSGRLTRQARQEALGAREPLIVIERDLLADWLLGTYSPLPAGPAPRLVEGEEPAT